MSLAEKKIFVDHELVSHFSDIEDTVYKQLQMEEEQVRLNGTKWTIEGT